MGTGTVRSYARGASGLHFGRGPDGWDGGQGGVRGGGQGGGGDGWQGWDQVKPGTLQSCCTNLYHDVHATQLSAQIAKWHVHEDDLCNLNSQDAACQFQKF